MSMHSTSFIHITYMRLYFYRIIHFVIDPSLSIFRRRFPDREKDACQIKGSMVLNKVAGNLHITAGLY